MNRELRRAYGVALALACELTSSACSIRNYVFPDVAIDASDATDDLASDANDAIDAIDDNPSDAMLPPCDASITLTFTPGNGPTTGGTVIDVGSSPAETWTSITVDGVTAQVTAPNQFVLPVRPRIGRAAVVASNGQCTASGSVLYELRTITVDPPAPPRSGFFARDAGTGNEPVDVEAGSISLTGGPAISVLFRNAPNALQLLHRTAPNTLDWVASPPQPPMGSDFRDSTILANGWLAIAPYFGSPLVVCTTQCDAVGTNEQFVAVSGYTSGSSVLLAAITAHSDDTPDFLVTYNGSTLRSDPLAVALSDRRMHRIAAVRVGTGGRVIVPIPSATAGIDSLARFGIQTGVSRNSDVATPSGLVTAAGLDTDSNGDGDLVVLGTSNGTVLRWVVGGGSPTMVATLLGSAPTGPVWSGDVNGDGATDVAFPRYDTGTIEILLGDGRGQFVEQSFDVGMRGCTHARAVAAGVLAAGESPVIAVACVRDVAGSDGGTTTEAGVLVLETRTAP